MKNLLLLPLSTCLMTLLVAVSVGNASRPTLRASASLLEISQGQPVGDSLLPLLIIDAQGANSYVGSIPLISGRRSTQSNINPDDRVELQPSTVVPALDSEQPQNADESLSSPERFSIPVRRQSGPAVVRSIRVSPTGQVMVSGDDEDEIQLWDIATGEELHTWRSGRSERTQAVEFTPDGNTIISGGVVAGQLRLWQWQDNLRQVQDSPLANVYSVDISPDGELIATGHSGGVINLWNRELELVRSIQAYAPSTQGNYGPSSKNVVAIEFSPNGTRLASRGIGRLQPSPSVQIIEVSSGQIIKTLHGDTSGGVDSIAYSPDGDILAGYYEGTYSAGIVRFWNPNTGAVIADLETNVVRPHAIAFSPDGEFIAIAGLSDLIEVWSVERQEIVQTFTSGLNFHHVYSIDFVPNSRTFVTSGVAALQDTEGTSYQGTIMIWALAREDVDE